MWSKATKPRFRQFRHFSSKGSRFTSRHPSTISFRSSKLICINENSPDRDRAALLHRDDRRTLSFDEEERRSHSLPHHARLHGCADQQVFSCVRSAAV